MREKEPPPTKNNNIFTSVNDASRHTQPQRMKTHLFILFFLHIAIENFRLEKKQDRLAIIVDQKLLAKSPCGIQQLITKGMMIDDGNYGLSRHTLTAIVVSVAYNVFESAGKVEKKKKIEKKK